MFRDDAIVEGRKLYVTKSVLILYGFNIQLTYMVINIFNETFSPSWIRW